MITQSRKDAKISLNYFLCASATLRLCVHLFCCTDEVFMVLFSKFFGVIIMRNFLFAAACLLPILTQAYEEEILFENDQISVFKWKMMPGEAVGPHRDQNPQLVFALQGGVITRIGEDGSRADFILPTGKAVLQEVDSELHDGINASDAQIEAITIELKTK